MINIRFRDRTNTWPGFVDLFSNLVIILIFLMIVFVFLWTTTGVFNARNGAHSIAELRQANAAQAEKIAQMAATEEEAKQLLILARSQLEQLEKNNIDLANELNTVDISMDELITQYESKVAELQSRGTDMQRQVAELNKQLADATANADATAALDAEKIAELEQAQTDLATQRADLSEQLAKLQAALDAANAKSAAQEVEYVEMSTRLNRALADKVAELNNMAQYQSAFYKAVKIAMGDRTTLQPDGDRFIVSSDILFPSGSYKLSKSGKEQLKLLAGVIKDMEHKIPSDIDWIIRVDGHTDSKPVMPGTRAFRNNTQLSLLRATAVADELAHWGVSPRRLLPSGFGELHPVELGTDPASLQKNRRIELQLTNR